jgi:WD40 repeat protein
MTSMIWDSSLEDSIIAKYEDHTEFVLGVDFNLFHESQIATTSWDETVRVFKYNQGWGKPKRMESAAAGMGGAVSSGSAAGPSA